MSDPSTTDAAATSEIPSYLEEPEGPEKSRHFSLGSIVANPSGWGPSTSSLPQHLIGLPFMPFNKHEKLSRISDWNFQRTGLGQFFMGQQRDPSMSAAAIQFGGSTFRPEDDEGLIEGDDGGAFSLVDNKPSRRPRAATQMFKPINKRQQTASRPQSNRTVIGRMNPRQNNVQNNRNAPQNNQRVQPTRPPIGGAKNNIRRPFIVFDQKESRPSSVEVNEHWKLEKDIEISDLSGVTFEPIDVEDIEFAGSLHQFNLQYARLLPKTAVSLQRFESRQFFAASTNEDPILTKLIGEKAAKVFATDSILSLLMSCPRSVNSWDVLLKKTSEGVLIFDKRTSSRIDYLSVSENFQDALSSQEKDSINHSERLAVEATVINHNFSQQVLTNVEHSFEHRNPFLDSLGKSMEAARVAFRYRKWHLGNDLTLIARTSLNGFVEKKSSAEEKEKSFIVSRALNEFDPKISGSVDWRQKLETQTGAVLAAEMKSNAFKLARWAAEATLAGADEFRLGFVSRVNFKNSYKHVILMTKQYSPQTFSESVNIKLKTLWGSLKILIDRCNQLKAGNYLLLRDPQKPIIHIYSVPADAFDKDPQHDEESGEAKTQE